MCAAALLWRWMYSVLASSGQPETRWSMVLSKRPHSLHFRSTSGFLRMLCWCQRVEKLWSWAAMIKPSVSALGPAAFSYLWVFVLVHVNLFHLLWVFYRGALLIPTWTWAVGDPGVWPWPLCCKHRWCSPHPLQMVLQALPVHDWTSLTVCWWSTRISCRHGL